VCIHPGAGQPARRWPAEQFAAVADALAGRGFRVVLTGTADEAGLTQAVAAKSARRPIDMAGRTSLGALGVLLSRARLVVCNDTGVSHLAAALRVPSVVIFTRTFLSGPTPGRWAPLDRELHRVVSPHFEVDETRFTHLAAAQRCLGDGCSAFQRVIGEPSDLNIPTQAVMRQVEDLLSKEHVRLA
jgi:ADP-heptose:LPS heptosyltransferase